MTSEQGTPGTEQAAGRVQTRASDRVRRLLAPRAPEVGWVVFAVANIAVILRLRNYQTVPFHFVWISLSFLYGFRVWRPRATIAVLLGVCLATGLALWVVVRAGNAGLDEVTEVPLMAAVFVAMVWHARRRQLAIDAVEAALRREHMATERLREADAMKDTFLQAVSHELRTPLTVIVGIAGTLERDDVRLDATETRQLTGLLGANARKLRSMLSDLLDLDRMSRGILEPKRTTTDVGELVRQAVEASAVFGARPIELELEPVVVSVDGPKVDRIVDNLLVNAERHTPPGTPLRVLVRAEGEGVLIGVDDEGPGVPHALQEIIFEPFRQGDGNDMDGQGSGIGLSLVSRFAELHGGRAWVTDRDGGGASFRVYLPGNGNAPREKRAPASA
jgi:two-component system OmpR family sensor kinase